MICARSQPILMKTSPNSTHSSRFFIHALRIIILMLHSGGDDAPALSTPTRQRDHPSRAADAHGILLPSWPGEARGRAVNQGPHVPRNGVLPRHVECEDLPRGSQCLTKRDASIPLSHAVSDNGPPSIL